jgi:hypothetical protein
MIANSVAKALGVPPQLRARFNRRRWASYLARRHHRDAMGLPIRRAATKAVFDAERGENLKFERTMRTGRSQIANL